MDPTTPAPQPIEPQQPQQQFSPSPGNGPKKKLLILIGAALLVVVLAIVLVMVFKGKKSDTEKQASDTSLYYNRPGYDRKSLAGSIGDPLAVKLTASDGAQKLSDGTVAIPACALFTQDDLAKAGIKQYVNDYGYPVVQNYLDKSGKAAFAPDPNHMLLDSDTMSCSYGVDGGSFTIAVNQPFTTTEGAIASDIAALNYAKQADMSGFQVYKRAEKLGDKTNTQFVLRKNGATIKLTLPYTDDAKLNGLVKTVMTNFDALASKQKGVTQVSYQSPTFTQSYAKACDLYGNDEVKQLTGADASPLVRAFWPTATGVADFSAVSDYKTKTNYIRSQCIRSSNDPAYNTLVGTKNHTLQVTTTSYENVQAASKGLQYISVGEGNDSATKGSGVGEEAYLYKTPKDHQLALAFRQGRVVVEVIYDFAFQSTDANTYAQQLSPVGEKIASELKSFN